MSARPPAQHELIERLAGRIGSNTQRASADRSLSPPGPGGADERDPFDLVHELMDVMRARQESTGAPKHATPERVTPERVTPDLPPPAPSHADATARRNPDAIDGAIGSGVVPPAAPPTSSMQSPTDLSAAPANQPRPMPDSPYVGGAAQDLAGLDPAELFRRTVASLRRNIPLVLASMIACTALGAAYAQWQEPRYTARASLIIDPRVDEGLASLQVPTVLLADALVVDSEVEVLRSRRLLRRVADRLAAPGDTPTEDAARGGAARDNPMGDNVLKNEAGAGELLTGSRASADPARLEDAPDRQAEPVGAEGAASDPEVSLNGAPPPVAVANGAVDLSRAYDIRREGTTFVVNIAATTGDPELSAELANLLAEEYIAQARATRIATANEARDWLTGELANLGEAVRAAETRVKRFLFENAIPDETAIGVVEQELAANETRLIAAQSDLRSTQSERATLDRALAEIASAPEGERADRAARQAQLVTALGGLSNPRTTQIEDELTRLRDARSAQIEIAEAVIAPLVLRNEELQSTLAEIGEKQIDLRDLRRGAAAMQAQYESLLARLQTTESESTFFRSNARLIEEAVPPERPSAPEARLLAAAAGFGGLLLGLGLVFFREQIDDSLRASDDVSATLGLRYLGAVPRIGWRDSRAVADFLPAFRHLPRAYRREVAAMTRAARDPHAFAAEVFRRTAIELRRRRGATGPEGAADRPMIVAAVSAVSGEGKSIFAANLAFFLAAQGARVLLVDADLRNPQLTQSLRPLGEVGLRMPGEFSFQRDEGAMRRTDDWQPFAPGQDPARAVRAVPITDRLAFAHKRDGAGAFDVEQALEDIVPCLPAWAAEGGLDRCEIVVLDTSPFGFVSDSLAYTSQLDAGILVVRWGHTRAGTLRRLLGSETALSERLVGAVLSRVRPAALKRYEHLPSSDGYYGARR